MRRQAGLDAPLDEQIEPLPLASSDGSPERRASPDSRKRCSACTVVMPMSKTRPLTE
jgi:hypothetical protein